MKNSYGNYVMQKALRLTCEPLKSKMISVMEKAIESIEDKKIANKWRSIISSHLTEISSHKLIYLKCDNNVGKSDV